jgi:hypothetical protein
MTAPEELDGNGTARIKAAKALRETSASDGPMMSIAWSLLSIAGDLAAIRRELHWQGRQGAKRGH